MQTKKDNIFSLLNIPKMENLADFSYRVGLSKKLLFRLSRENVKYYNEVQIPKKNGKLRTLHIPCFMLYVVQRWILINILNKIEISNYAMAFRKGYKYGIKGNASIHKNTLYGLSIDLEDFFGSVTEDQVYRVFRKIGYNKVVSAILSNICTLNNSLPQGAPTSPMLSNLVLVNLDNKLERYCSNRGIVFSRYADDMYFSCDDPNKIKKLYKPVESMIEEFGFKVNNNKTHYQSPYKRKRITGVTITRDGELKAPKEFKHRLRSMIFHDVKDNRTTRIDIILGSISFVSSIEKDYKDKMVVYIRKLMKKDPNNKVALEILSVISNDKN